MDRLLARHRNEIIRIAHVHGATQVRVFGSRARGAASTASDVDLLVRLAPDRSILDLVAIQQDLEDLLGCPVHVVTEAAISRYFRDQVLREAVAL